MRFLYLKLCPDCGVVEPQSVTEVTFREFTDRIMGLENVQTVHFSAFKVLLASFRCQKCIRKAEEAAKQAVSLHTVEKTTEIAENAASKDTT